jgi:hypothetical protein
MIPAMGQFPIHDFYKMFKRFIVSEVNSEVELARRLDL